MLKLLDTYEHYKNLPHQDAAIAYLDTQLSEQTRERFTAIWRTSPGNIGGRSAKAKTPYLLADKILSYCQHKNYEIEAGTGEIFIVYLEGANADGSPNPDKANHFNDRRIVIRHEDGIPKIIGNWEATTEPGDYWTNNPMNAAGAARIKFGQYRAWQVGRHGSRPYEALVQTAGIVAVLRDRNKDFSRVGDKEYQGTFGINQHHGYDSPINRIGRNSAGCLVGRTIKGHREFMTIVKSDPRYQKSQSYAFLTTIIAADDLRKIVG